MNFCKIYFCFFKFKLLSLRLYNMVQRIYILKAKVYNIHEEDHDIHRLRFHPVKKIMMEIGFVQHFIISL